MINVSVTIPPALLRLDSDFTQHTLKAFDAGVIGLVADVRRRSPIDTGDLRDGFYGIGARVQAGEFTAGIANDVANSLYRVRGRGPGNPPPTSAVAGWANRRGISPYLVARSIGRRGTQRWRDNTNVLDIERDSRPGNERPQKDGVLIDAANAIARNVNSFTR